MASLSLTINTLNLTVQLGTVEQTQNIIATLARIEQKVNQLQMTDQEVLDALKAIDTATTTVATNVDLIAKNTANIATLGTTIDGEVKALLTLAQQSGVPQNVQDAITALSAKTAKLQTDAQAASDAAAAQVPVLQAIATEGATNPVPVPVPPPPPPPGG